FQAEDGIRDFHVTGVQTCALPICTGGSGDAAKGSAAALSLAGALLILALKFGAYLVTGSVGLLSDAAESLVNLVAAVVLTVALEIGRASCRERVEDWEVGGEWKNK